MRYRWPSWGQAYAMALSRARETGYRYRVAKLRETSMPCTRSPVLCISPGRCRAGAVERAACMALGRLVISYLGNPWIVARIPRQGYGMPGSDRRPLRMSGERVIAERDGGAA